MSVTIIDVSDSLTSRDFAAARIGMNRFTPEESRAEIFAGMVMSDRHDSHGVVAGGSSPIRSEGKNQNPTPKWLPRPSHDPALHPLFHGKRRRAHLDLLSHWL